MKNRVTYSAEQREIAKRENLRLITIQTGHRGGGSSITLQGPVTEDEHAEVQAFLLAFLKKRAERLKERDLPSTA